MYDHLKSNIRHLGHFSEEEMDVLISKLEVLRLKKGDHFLKEGQVSNHIAFVNKGLAMHYQIYEGEEIPCDFTTEGNWLAYLKSFTSREPSEMNIKVLEDTDLFSFSGQKLQELFEEQPKFQAVKSYNIEKSFVELAKRSSDLTVLDAKKRYQQLVQTRPDLINRVPQYYLAAFLGIKPQSLSRIRKEMD
jgi:CRP/FNR family transcriptional regulator, anaerobic regulatory protein